VQRCAKRRRQRSMLRLRRETELLSDTTVKLPCLPARSESFIDVVFGLIQPFRERPRLVLSRGPKVIEKLSHDFAATP
jgi:hypothetical protein